jgi:hypothetical protein
MPCNKKTYTLTFDEKAKGWTSFHSYSPDFVLGMNNKFFSFNNGDLWEHHSDDVDYNTYYGVQSPSKVSVMVNQEPSTIKEIQAVSLEGNYSWNTLINAYIGMVDDATSSTISSVEFVRKEGIWFAYARRNEDTNQLDSKSTYGIGVITEVNPTNIVVNGYSGLLTTGDTIIKDDLTVIGTVISRSTTQGITTIEIAFSGAATVGDFVIGQKNARIEGGNLRGYTMRIDLDVTQDDKVELFSVNAEVMKSFP